MGGRTFAPGVARVRLPLANAYMIGEWDGPWVLVDTGMPGSDRLIQKQSRHRFGARPPEAVILTHGHIDHSGGLSKLLEQWPVPVPVYAHELELPYLTGVAAYPPADPAVGGGLMPMIAPSLPVGPFDFRPNVLPLPEDGSVPGMNGWRWLHTPGHTPGHVSLLREEDGVLLAGDAIVTTPQESLLSAVTHFPREVRRPPAYLTPDWAQARASVLLLAELQPRIVAAGHGDPMRGDVMREELLVLAQQFDELAWPSYGRYANRTVEVDADGVRRVPPSVPNRNAKPLGLGALGAAALGAVLIAMRNR